MLEVDELADHKQSLFEGANELPLFFKILCTTAAIAKVVKLDTLNIVHGKSQSCFLSNYRLKPGRDASYSLHHDS